jgi:hypothetical protein
MRLIYPIIVLFLLAGLSAGQLAPDRERFDIVLHPGEVEEKALTLTNSGDTPILKIDSTPVSGNAKDLIFMNMPEVNMLPPGEKIEGSVFFAIPPETRPGSYTGFIYLLDSTINDAKSASTFAKADEPATFDLSIRNLGRFRDVASIDVSSLPEGWTVSLLDGEDEHPLPYELSLNPGINHPMVLQVQPSVPGDEGELIMTATSLGNKSKNDTVRASAEFGLEIRAYNVKVDLPERMVANRTYSGDFKIALEVEEDVSVGIITPMELMVIPLTQVIEVTPERPGKANFTMLASHTGEYPIIFKLMDSNGMPMPDELATVKVVEPEGVAILTGDEFLYKTVASLCRPENRSIPVVTLSAGRLSEKDSEGLQSYAKVVILGNESIVPADIERSLDVTEVKRLKGDNLCEVTWRFVSEIWQNGTAEAVLSGMKQTDIFRAYQEARLRNLPLIVCDSPMNNVTRSIAEDLTKRNTSLSKVLAVGEISPETAKELEGLNISIEEVAQ